MGHIAALLAATWSPRWQGGGGHGNTGYSNYDYFSSRLDLITRALPSNETISDERVSVSRRRSFVRCGMRGASETGVDAVSLYHLGCYRRSLGGPRGGHRGVTWRVEFYLRSVDHVAPCCCGDVRVGGINPSS